MSASYTVIAGNKIIHCTHNLVMIPFILTVCTRMANTQ